MIRFYIFFLLILRFSHCHQNCACNWNWTGYCLSTDFNRSRTLHSVCLSQWCILNVEFVSEKHWKYVAGKGIGRSRLYLIVAEWLRWNVPFSNWFHFKTKIEWNSLFILCGCEPNHHPGRTFHFNVSISFNSILLCAFLYNIMYYNSFWSSLYP